MRDPGTGSPSRMIREAAEAPAAIARQIAANAALCRELGRRLRRSPPRFVVTCARGSSDHAASYAKFLFEARLGIVTASVAPSVGSIYRSPLRMPDTLFLAVSQSGRSPDLLALTEAARAGGAFTLALVNDEASPLARACDACLPLLAGPELSVAATKSCLAAMSAALQLFTHWSGDAGHERALAALPDQLAQAAGLDWSVAAPSFAATSDLFVVGRGPGLAIAQEAALKLKETAMLHAEAYSAAELMHGPIVLVGPGFPVLVLSQDDESRPSLVEATRRLLQNGADLFAAEPDPVAPARLPVVPGMHGATAPLALLQSFYGLADEVARRRGLDPDSPRHLRKVTETL